MLDLLRYIWRHPLKVYSLLLRGRISDPSYKGPSVCHRSDRWFWLQRISEQRNSASIPEYQDWIKSHLIIAERDIDLMKAAVRSWRGHPTISIVVPALQSAAEAVLETISDIREQAYDHWELHFVVGPGTAADVRRVVECVAAEDERIRVVVCSDVPDLVASASEVIDVVHGQWLVFIEPGVRLARHALFVLSDAANRLPDSQLFYADEDRVGSHGERCEPQFKPGMNLELLRACNYIGSCAMYAVDLLKRLRGFRSGYPGSEHHDLILRAIDEVGTQAVSHLPYVLFSKARDPAVAGVGVPESSAKAVSEHIARRGVAGLVNVGPFGLRVRYEPRDGPESVSIIIPTHNRCEVLKVCVESVLSTTGGSFCELIIVDHLSDDPGTLSYLGQLQNLPRVRILRDEAPFNFSRLNNRAAAIAKGKYLLLLNNDTQAITSAWLDELLGIMAQADVGAVGVKLLYPDHTVQHAGVVIGLNGLAGHVHTGIGRDDAGYLGRARLSQEFGAVTGACMMLRRSDYRDIRGMDEDSLPVAFNDIDLCLKLRRVGKRIVWTPYVEFVHHESLSRGDDDTAEKRARLQSEIQFMQSKWADELSSEDPGYNPNLSLWSPNFSIASKPRIKKPW